jgi:hypothetical protein
MCKISATYLKSTMMMKVWDQLHSVDNVKKLKENSVVVQS